jgi:hypothetical protein
MGGGLFKKRNIKANMHLAKGRFARLGAAKH